MCTERIDHENVCKSILVQCPRCKSFQKIGFIDQHEDKCFQERLQVTIAQLTLFINQHPDLRESFNQNFSPTPRNNLRGVEIFNQSRQANCFIRLRETFNLILLNPSVAHSMLLNLLIHGMERLNNAGINFISDVTIWIDRSSIREIVFPIMFDELSENSFRFLFATASDTSVILCTIFSLIIWSSQLQISHLQLNTNFQTILSHIFYVIFFIIFLLMMRFYFESLSSSIIIMSWWLIFVMFLIISHRLLF